MPKTSFNWISGAALSSYNKCTSILVDKNLFIVNSNSSEFLISASIKYGVFPVIFLINAYKIFLSPFFSNSCKFYPTCSSYALDCFKEFNFFTATLKSIIRIIKCNPWFKTGGHDPVKKGDG